MPRTLTALYDTRDHAEQAREQLLSNGLSSGDVTLSSAETGAGSSPSQSSGGGFMQSLKNFFMPEDDHHTYAEGVSRGGVLLTARVPEGREDEVMQILDSSGAIDLDERQEAWRSAGWEGRSQSLQNGATTGAAEEATIPIAEERLQVGKREVDRGSVRVRSYVHEEPVHEQVNLREEHVEIERTPVNERIAGAADGIFEERTFEVSEHGEEPVVAKETVVTDELRVTKEATERTHDIEDTVRRTDVDVDDQRDRGGLTGRP